uniref:phosphorylase family protein n=1 Tax=Streptobacillus moniliformis TaxID=34105 RepID=UPI000AB463FA
YYESASETRVYGRLGSDARGMCTVAETIAANYVGIKTSGISCITNMAARAR